MHECIFAVLRSKIAAHDGKEKFHVESHSDSTSPPLAQRKAAEALIHPNSCDSHKENPLKSRFS